MIKSINDHPYYFAGNKGPYINTYLGRSFHILNPEPDSIELIDIAHHLSMQCRSVGAITRHYSIAQHSLFVSQLVAEDGADKLTQLQALMHDSEEYITGDWPKPVKECISSMHTKRIVRDIKRAIGVKFGLDLLDMPPVIKRMDNVAMATERAQLYLPSNVVWHNLPDPDLRPLPYMEIAEAERLFIDRFMELALQVIPNLDGEEWWKKLNTSHKL